MALSPVGPWVSGVYWTLAIEIVFYLLVAIVLKIWGTRALTLLGMFLGFYSSTFWWAHVVNAFIGDILRPLFTSIEGLNGYLLLMHHGCYFGLGIVLWHGATSGWRPRTIGTALFFGLSGALGIAGAARGIAPLLTVGSYTPNYLIPPAIWCVAVLAIVASIVWSDQIESALSSRRKIVRFLGLLTYPLYLVHEDMGRAVMVAMRRIGAFGALAIGMVVVVAVSVLVTLIEKRLQAYIGGRFAVRTPAAQLP